VDIEAQIRAGHTDVEGLCRALADWSAELRLLLVDRTNKGRRGVAPATDASQLGRNQALIE
jgi:hypothetical protein